MRGKGVGQGGGKAGAWSGVGCGNTPSTTPLYGVLYTDSIWGLPPVKIVNIFNQPVENFIKKVSSNY